MKELAVSLNKHILGKALKTELREDLEYMKSLSKSNSEKC